MKKSDKSVEVVFILLETSSAIHIGAAFSGENLGLREVEPGRWLVSFMDLDLGYIDPKNKEFEPII